MEQTRCIHEETGQIYWVCSDALLTSGELCQAFFGPCGAYIVADRVRGNDPQRLFDSLKKLLDVHHLCLYVVEQGQWNPVRRLFEDLYPDDDSLAVGVDQWMFHRRPLYKAHALEQMAAQLRLEDAKAVGYLTLEDGEIMVYRHGELKPASSHNPEFIFYMTLFGGCFGLHRFAVGKIFSGLVYLFTCGFFLIGWLSDLVFLFLSIQKDSLSKYLLPLSNRLRKLPLFLLAIPVNLLLLTVYFSFSQNLTTALVYGAAQQMDASDAIAFDMFIKWLTSLISGS